MTFDPTKPVQTRDGRKARILAADIKNVYPILAVIEETSGREVADTFKSDGRILVNGESHSDLINIPEKTTSFVNMYAREGYKTLQEAKCYQGDNCIGVIEMTIVDGKLIDVIVHS
jgi:hypothetical protein